MCILSIPKRRERYDAEDGAIEQEKWCLGSQVVLFVSYTIYFSILHNFPPPAAACDRIYIY